MTTESPGYAARFPAREFADFKAVQAGPSCGEAQEFLRTTAVVSGDYAVDVRRVDLPTEISNVRFPALNLEPFRRP